MIDFTKLLPSMESGQKLITALSIIPKYDESICEQDQTARLVALSDLYQIYIPSQMSIEIYSKLYLALLRSMQKKGTQMAIKQRYENYKAIQQQSYSGILGGSDSFTIIGTSGIGKSSAISRSISLITENQIIETDKPYTKIIPCLIVQCPFDSSVKGLLLEILRKVDEGLGTDHYHHAITSRAATTDMLIGAVSSIALNHIGMLVVDEIQNVANSKNGKNLIGALTQLINNSGISICMVGTPECTVFFEQAMQLARRSVGLQYTAMNYDEYFQSFCKVLFQYQYTRQRTEITPAITEWLYEHSAGVISVVVSLVHDAQEIAILTGKEVLNLETLNEAYQQRLSLLHCYIKPSVIQNKPTAKKKNSAASIKNNTVQSHSEQGSYSISDMAEKSRAERSDIVELLKEICTIVEVAI
nr:MAG TPA: Bacterial TniB protein [Caudoviricetes sp.]